MKSAGPVEPEQDDFKENVPPKTENSDENAQQTEGKRRLSGILTPSTDIPFDPAGAPEESETAAAAATVPPVSRALFSSSTPLEGPEIDETEQMTRHYCAPLLPAGFEEVDFTVPSAMAFARNLHIQSTPMHPGRPSSILTMSEEATFNLPRGKSLLPVTQATTVVQHQEDAAASLQMDLLPSQKSCPPPTTTRRGLSPIDEMSREYFSSSGSSAGTTGLSVQQSRLSVALSRPTCGRVYPAHFDPFDMEHRQGQLAHLSVPLEDRPGFYSAPGRPPWLRANSSVQLGPLGDQYVVKQAIGQGAYAKIYEAHKAGSSGKVVLKVQERDGPWEFYILMEIQMRLNSQLAADGGFLTVDRGYFYETGGSVLVQPFLAHGTLLDLVNHYRSKVKCLV